MMPAFSITAFVPRRRSSQSGAAAVQCISANASFCGVTLLAPTRGHSPISNVVLLSISVIAVETMLSRRRRIFRS
jgi:hypothetical protein